jgi:hypothetical protein
VGTGKRLKGFREFCFKGLVGSNNRENPRKPHREEYDYLCFIVPIKRKIGSFEGK